MKFYFFLELRPSFKRQMLVPEAQSNCNCTPNLMSKSNSTKCLKLVILIIELKVAIKG